MRYYVMEPTGIISLPTVPKGEKAAIVLVNDSSRLCEIDYDAHRELISERLKLLMEMYVPDYDFMPVVFYDKKNDVQIVFWRFRPALYSNYNATFRNDGIVAKITFPDQNVPLVFTAQSPRGVRSIVVNMAVSESILRRSILGLKFTKVNDY